MTDSQTKQWQLTAITEALGELELIVDDKLSVGRGKDNDVILGSKQVSRQHAELSVNDNKLLVQDLGSSNGTLVNSTKLEPNKPTALSEEDVVTFAAFSFKVKQVPYAAPAATPVKETQTIEPASVEQEPVTDPATAKVNKEPLVKKASPEVAAKKQVEENAEAVEKADIKNMNKEELERELEQELEEPIAFGDPDQKQPTTSSEEYYEELATEADPEVHKSKQAASAQMSATAQIHEEVDQAKPKQVKSTETKTVEPKAAEPAVASKGKTTAPVANDAPEALDNLEKTKIKEASTKSFNTVNEQPQHKVAHVNNSTPTPNKAESGKSNMFLWLALILIGLAVVLWLYNSGTLG